jgi:hypothetical protein
MPYILKERRLELTNNAEPVTPGELNYVITKIIILYLARSGGVNYTNINAVIGVLTCIIQELYRRVAVPYESKKIQENGDVYTKLI